MSAPTLMHRALAMLTRREHSRLELERKLARFAESAEALGAVLDDLERSRLLSAERFSQSLVHRREERYGSERITRELEQHQLDPDIVRERRAELAGSETERCYNVWQKKFGSHPADLEERARQVRFLTARGFSADVIRDVLKRARG